MLFLDWFFKGVVRGALFFSAMDPHTREQNQKIRPILDGFFMFDGLKKVAVVPIGRGIRPRQSKTRQPLVEKRITGSPDFDRSGCPKTTKTRRKPRVLWCRQRDLNSRPDDYKSTALPTELSWLTRNFPVHKIVLCFFCKSFFRFFCPLSYHFLKTKNTASIISANPTA